MIPSYASAAVEQAAAPAADDVAMVGDEIIVTARKRAESLQNVPVSITAVNAALIERNNIVRIDQVGALTPNVVLQPISTIPTGIAAYIRGVGNRAGEPSQDNPIVISVDGVYLAGISGSLVDVFDVQQIEILRGPQGTLQGRNSPGGAINVTTRRPTGEFGARAEVSYARFDELRLRGSVEAPLVEGVLAAKVSGYLNRGGNFMTNTMTGNKEFGGQKVWGGRLGLLYTPSAAVKAYLTVDYTRDTSPNGPLRPVPYSGSRGPLDPEPLVCAVAGFCTPYGKFENGANFLDHPSSWSFGTSLNVDIDLGPATLTSVTGYRKTHENINVDDDALPAVVIHVVDRLTKQYALSEELRLASNGDRRFSYVVGGIVTRAKFDLVQPLLLTGALANLPDPFLAIAARQQVTNSYAIFGQAVYKLTDAWSISGGARQTFDRKNMHTEPSGPGPSGTVKGSFNKLTAEAGTEYRLDSTKLAYFHFSQGYRAGGINGDAASLAAVNVYKPEEVNSFEVGLKTAWLDRALTLNMSAFYYNYKNLQVTALDVFPGGYTTRIVNANGLDIKGVELEAVLRPVRELTINASLGYLDAKYKSQIIDLGFGSVDMKGLTKDNAPKWTGYLGVDYSIPLGSDSSLTLSGDLNYKSTYATQPVPSLIGFQDSYALVNGSITWKAADERYTVSIFGRNLTNKYYKVIGENGGGLFAWEVPGRPRTFGIRVATKL